MKALLIAVAATFVSFTSAIAESGSNTNRQDALEQFESVAAKFYDGDSLQKPEKFMKTYSSLSVQDRELCTEVCQGVRTQRQTFCEQFMAAQASTN